MQSAQRQKILVVDDDLRLRDLLKRYLAEQGFAVDTVADAAAMDRQLARVRYDLLVLDLMLPGEDGLAICRRLRSSNALGRSDRPNKLGTPEASRANVQQNEVPIIMLTARGDDVDRIVGLEMGADDYLAKPFNPRELVARIHAVLRRRAPAALPGAPSADEHVVDFGPYSLNLGTRSLTKDGASVPLTTGEFALLKVLASHPREPMSRDKLMDLARGREHESYDRSIDVQVSRLRKLLGEDPQSPRYIQTVWGFGYVFVPDGIPGGISVGDGSRGGTPLGDGIQMKFLPGSLLWRTLAVMIVALALSQAAAVYLLHEFITQPRVRLGIGQFVSHLKTVSAALQTMTPEQQNLFMARIAENEGIRIMPVRGSEPMRLAGDVPPVRLFREHVRRIIGPESEVYVRAGEGRPGQMLFVKLPSGQREFWVAFPRRRIERDPGTAFVAWGAVGLAIAVVATFFILWRLTRPLQELASAAEKVGRGAPTPDVGESGPSEVRAVARAFNQMRAGLQRSERERATFLAGISHDLRTPLSRLRLDIEMLGGKVEPEVQRAMIADLGDMNAIIDQFIDFTRAEASEPLSAVNLSELARSCAERAARAGVAVRCELAEIPLAMLRPLALQRLVDNLIANAARHAGGDVLVRTSGKPGEIAVAVLDRGPGIPAGLVEHLKEPFTRKDASRSGTSGAGLGLAIANRVATLHGGRLDLLPRDGGGLEARATFPTAP